MSEFGDTYEERAHNAETAVATLRSRLADSLKAEEWTGIQLDKAERRVAEAERDMDQLIGERDHAQGMADKLADAIATLLGVEIGEHSNMNCPWTQALEAFEDRPTASTSGPKCERCSDTGWIQGDPVFGISDEPCGCAEAVDALAARLAETEALRKAVKGFLDDYVSADGMYDMKHYVREFRAAMEQGHE